MHGGTVRTMLTPTKSIYFATGSRADYGIVRRYLKMLSEDRKICLSLLVTGALLSSEFGHQEDLIYQDGLSIKKEIPIPLDISSNCGVLHAMSVALDEFGIFFENERPDLLIILGDRYEMLAVAISAAMNKIPILHIHGGEATYGNYDEFIRHSITKMSWFHFTATERYRERVIQLGEDPNRVFNLGALGAENCLYIEEALVPEKVKLLSKEQYFVVLFHPETLTNKIVGDQIEELLKAITHFKEYIFVFIGSNSDTSADVIRRRVKTYTSIRNNTIYFENLTTSGYHYLLKHSMALIGNSSSGLIEAPSLGINTINIGDRQKGRIRCESVYDVKCIDVEIVGAIEAVLSSEKKEIIFNPYFRENTAENYYLKTIEVLKRIENGIAMEPKHFYDLNSKF